MSRVLSFVLALTMVITLPVIPGKKVEAANGKKSGWNLNIYMCGSDLESGGGAATTDILEIFTAKNVPSNVNVFIETGGSTYWYYKEDVEAFYKNELGMNDETIASLNVQNIDADHICRYKVKFDNEVVQDGKTIVYPSLECVASNLGVENPELAEKLGVKTADMGDPEVLTEFVRNCGGKYDHNILAFWNHGGGPAGGVCYDEWTEDDDHITLRELNEVMAANNDVLPDGKFDIMGYDCCLMGSLESLVVLGRYAKYGLASVTSEPNGGWDYGPMVQEMADQVNGTKSYSAAEIAKIEVDAYANFYYGRDIGGDDAMLAAYDFSTMPAIVDKFDEMSEALLLMESSSTLYTGIHSTLRKVFEIESTAEIVSMDSFLKKMTAYAKNYINKNSSSSHPLVQTNVENCKNFVAAATDLYDMIYNSNFIINHASGDKGSPYLFEKGVSLFCPTTDTNQGLIFAQEDYKALGISDYWRIFAYQGCFKETAKIMAAPQSSVSFVNSTQKYTLTVKEPDYCAFAGTRMFVKYGNTYVQARNKEVTLNSKGTATMPLLAGYVTLNGAPIYMTELEGYEGWYYSFLSVNGREQRIYFAYDEGEFYAMGLQTGDVIAPMFFYKDGSEKIAKDKSYTIKAADYVEDYELTLVPFKWKKAKESERLYDFACRNLYGDYSHNWVYYGSALNFAKATMTLDKTTFKATGEAICPKVTVKIGKWTLKKGTDYKLVYKNNIAAGTATVTVYGVGKYANAPKRTLTYKILVNKKKAA